MSDSLTQGSYGSEVEKECPKSPNGNHEYETTCGSWPSEERTCKYCGDTFYTK